MNKWPVSLLTLFLFSAAKVQALPEFLIQPVSINTIEARKVVFTCVAGNSALLSFFVNNVSATLAAVVNKGFIQTSHTLGDGSLRANLTVTASSSMNNNSVIKCTAFSPETDSDIVTLKVQGQLSSVIDLSYSFINSSTVTISWSPPFTLPGTDITGYNISATSNGTITNYFTSNSYYQLSLCVKANVTVSAYNGLEGESSSVLASSSGLYVSVDLNITNDLGLVVSTNFSDLCSNVVIISSSINVSSSSDNSTDSPMIVQVPPGIDILNYNTNLTVSEDTIYTVTVSYSIYDGDYTVTGSTSIDTYGVKSLTSMNHNDGNITVTCYFNPFSTDTICTVVARNGTDLDEVASEVFNRIGDIAQGNLTNIPPGVYDLLAYDEGSSMVVVILEGVTVEEPPTPTLSTTPDITDMTTMSTNSSSTTNTTSLTTIITVLSITASPSSESPTSSDECNLICIIIIIIVIVVVIIILIIITLGVGYCYYRMKKKGYPNEIKRNLSDNIKNMYDKPAKSGHAPVMYAELSGFNKPLNNKVQPQSPTIKQHDQPVVYSDVMIKDQLPPPPYEPTKIRETRLHSSATPTKTVITHPDEDIQEIFFHQH